MKTNKSTILFHSASLALLLMPALLPAASITKSDNTNALNLGTSWVGGTAPGAADVATWSGSYTADTNINNNSLRAFIANVNNLTNAWQGISVGALTGTALTTNTIATAYTNITAASQSGNIVTITTKAAHGFGPGQTVTIAGVTPAGYNGTFTVLGIPAATTFTYSTGSGLTAGTAFGTVESAIYIGGAGAAVTGSVLTNGSAGVDMSAASHSVVVNAAAFAFAGNQTWNVAAGRNLRWANNGTAGSAGTKAITSGTDGLIDISGGGIVDAAQGGDGTFAHVNGFTGFTGKWRVNTGATLRGLRNGATAWGSDTNSADAITLNGGTLAVGGIQGAVGNWTWTTPITLASGTTSYIDEQNIAGTGRSLKLNGGISGSGNLVFRAPLVGATTFTALDTGFVLTGTNSMSGTLVIGGPVENGVAGRLSVVRVGGISGNDASLNAGAGGSLGTATVTNNGVLTFARNDSHSVSNIITGTGSVRIGGGVTGADAQNVTFVGAKTYSGTTTIGRGTLTLDVTGSIPNTSVISLAPAGGFTATFDVSAVTGGFTLNTGQSLTSSASGISRNVTGAFTAASGSKIIGDSLGGPSFSADLAANAGSLVVPGGSNTVATLALPANLSLGGGTLLMDVLTNANDKITVAGDLTPTGVTTIQIVNTGGLTNGDYTVIEVTGNLNGTAANFTATGLPAGARQTLSVTYDTGSAPKRVLLTVSGAAASLVWAGDGVANVWNTLGATNWTNGLVLDQFYAGDSATFDDTGSTNPAVNITGTVLPSSVSVNASVNYTFSGTGGIGGSTTLAKTGTGTLTLANTNSYTGLTTVSDGILALTTSNSIPDANVVQTDGTGTLLVQTDKLFMTLTNGTGSSAVVQSGNVTVASSGSEDGATITQQGGSLTISNLAVGNADINVLTGTMRVLAGSATAASVVNVASGATLNSGGSLLGALTNSGTVYRSNTVDTAQNQFTTTDALAFDGTIVLRGGTPSVNPGSLQGINTGFYWLHSAGGSQLAGTAFHLDTGSAANNGADVIVGDWDATSGNRLLTLASLTGYGALRSDAGADGFRHFVVDQAVNTTFNGLLLAHASPHAIPFLRSVFFEKRGAGTLTMANVMGRQTATASGTTNAEYSVQVNGGKLVMLATNTILGPIAVAGGAALEIIGAGLLGSGGSHAYVITNDGTLVLNSTANQSLSGVVTGTGVFVKTNLSTLFINGIFTNGSFVMGGGLLGGTGLVETAVSIPNGAGIAPGASIGTLTISNTLTLAAGTTNYFEVDATNGVSDMVVFNSATYGGVLVVSNLSGPGTLTNGQNFQIFSAGGAGAFSSVTPAPDAGKVWNFNAASGVLSVVATYAANPTNITFSVSGSTLTLSWPADHLGWFLQSQTNSRSIGLSSNWLDVPGSDLVTSTNITVNPADPTVFYRLRIP